MITPFFLQKNYAIGLMTMVLNITKPGLALTLELIKKRNYQTIKGGYLYDAENQFATNDILRTFQMQQMKHQEIQGLHAGMLLNFTENMVKIHDPFFGRTYCGQSSHPYNLFRYLFLKMILF